mmetsp:Transcript_71896/g.161365  ORF Transcript_71896/g.161365 Transcript_71896/m.161365 type:complete len:168 (-) Transcript_71896:169-672(-)
MGGNTSCQNGTKEACCACAEAQDGGGKDSFKGVHAVRSDYRVEELNAEQKAVESAERDAMREEQPRKAADGSMNKRTVKVTVKKISAEEKLGMDVKHEKGKLVVVDIVPGGAVDRGNKASLGSHPAGADIRIGDVIHQVNDVKGIDTAMVGECQLKTELRFKVSRGQ